MMKLRIAGSSNDSIVDGPGLRYTIFVQGCPHRCPGCQNPQTHADTGGKEVDIEKIWAAIERNPLLDGITLSGGEPFCQAQALFPIAQRAKQRGLSVWAYSGFTLEQLLQKKDPDIDALLQVCDVLVDGPYMQTQRSLNLCFRGSANQRLLDLPASLAHRAPVELRVDPVYGN